MKILIIVLCASFALFTGCQVVHFNNRSVVTYNENKAETYGTITNTPKSGDGNVAAEKTVEATSAVNTSNGSATTNANKSNPEKNPQETSQGTNKKEASGNE